MLIPSLRLVLGCVVRGEGKLPDVENGGSVSPSVPPRTSRESDSPLPPNGATRNP